MTVSADNFNIWDRLFNLIIERRALLRNRRQLQVIIKYLMQKLTDCGCENSQTVLRLAMMYQRWIRTGLGVPGSIITLRGVERFFDYILEPLNRENHYQLLDVSDGDKLLTAIDIGDLTYAKLLVKYGKIFQNNRFFNMSTGVMYLQTITHHIWTRIFLYEMNHSSCWEPAADVLNSMLHTNGRIGNNTRGFVRIFVIIRILYNMILKRQEYHREVSRNTFINNRIQCLQLYYRTINEPFVPEEDIRDFLKYLFYSEGNREETVEELVSIYRGMFPPESIRVYEPRSLKHQARCVVRSTLSYKNIPLPNIVNQLHLPVIIKYLLLGGCEFSSR